MAAFGKPIKAFAAKRGEPFLPRRTRPLIDHRLVHEVGVEKGTGDLRSAFDEDAGNAAMRQGLQRVLHVDQAVVVYRNGHDFRAVVMQRLGRRVRLAGGTEQPNGHHRVFEEFGAGRRP